MKLTDLPPAASAPALSPAPLVQATVLPQTAPVGPTAAPLAVIEIRVWAAGAAATPLPTSAPSLPGAEVDIAAPAAAARAVMAGSPPAPAPPSVATPTAPSTVPVDGAPPAAEPVVAISWTTRARPWLIGAALVAVVAVVAVVAWRMLHPSGPGPGFVSGNGRIEATEIAVSTKLGGRVQDILVNEGDFVVAGQSLAHMQVLTLDAQRNEALAQQQQAIAAVATAQAQVAARQSDREEALAVVAQRESELDAAQLRLTRSQALEREGASSTQELDDDRTRVRSARAAGGAARAQVQAAQAAIVAAQSQVAGARAAVAAAAATVVRIVADIDDSALVAPRDGRVQYRIAQTGEVLGAGGKVLELLDVGDVYMTFFVPEEVAGRLALGSEVRIVLDAAPQSVIPAKVSFVASTAQFTPKTVETASERQKLMFRVKAQLGRQLLQANLRQIKTGVPGVAWIRTDPKAVWPPSLALKDDR